MSAIVKQQRSLGALLMDRGLLSQPQLDMALQEQARTSEKLGKVLVRLGYVREKDILLVLQGLMAVLFKVGGEEFACESLQVREIIRYKEATPLPKSPPYMEGLFQYRGHVLPLMNLRVRLGLPRLIPSDQTRIIVYEEPRKQVGILVDEVGAVLQISRENVGEAPRNALGIPGSLIYGLARLETGVVTILNMGALLESGEDIALDTKGIL